MLARMGLLVSCLLLVVACSSSNVKGNGKIKTLARKVDAFNHIHVTGKIKLEVVSNAAQALKITADSNIIPLVMTDVRNHVLYIHAKKGYTLNPTQTISIQVNARNLRGIAASGSTKVRASNIKAKTFNIDTTGTARAHLSGKVGTVSVYLKGNSQIDAADLISNHVVVKLAGSGDAQVNANQSLYAMMSGSGDVIYTGNPKVVDQKAKGSGRVERLKK